MAAVPRAPPSHRLPCLRLPERCLPADSWWPGQTPAQEARLAGVRKRVMSAPVSAMMTSAVVFLTPGMVTRCSICGAKGRISWSIRAESSSMVADNSSMRVRCMRHKKVVLTKVAGEGLDQGGDLGSHPAPGHIRHDLRVVLAFDERGQHRPPGDTQDVGGYRTDLNPGVLELLLQPLGFPGTFDRQSGPVAGQVTQVPDRFGRDERRLQQPTLTQLGKPGRVRDIRLSTGQALGVRGVD